VSYQILFTDPALDDLGRLPEADYERVREVIKRLAREPRPTGVLRLVGRERWHLRVGGHLVVYAVDDEKLRVRILHIGRQKASIYPVINGQSGS
jgi:mRNA interferase RelE/StbE